MGTYMRIILTSMVALAAASAASIALPAAHAEPSSWQFRTPSGNIGCQLGKNPAGLAFAWCRADDHTWTAPAEGYCAAGNVPGAIGRPDGDDLQLSAGRPPCLGFVMSQMFFTGQYVPPVLDYGQQQSVGPITCTVEEAGVKCADSSTGHFFVTARESYQVG